MSSVRRLYPRTVRVIEALVLLAVFTAILEACSRRSPTGPGSTANLNIRAVMPAPGCPTCAKPQGSARSTNVAAAIDSLRIIVFEQTADGEILRAHVVLPGGVGQSTFRAEVVVPWALRFRVEVEAVGQRSIFVNDFARYTGYGPQYYGEATISTVPSVPEQVTIDLRNVVPAPAVSQTQPENVFWCRILGAISYTIHGERNNGIYADTTVTDTTAAFSNWFFAQVRANLRHGKTSAASITQDIPAGPPCYW